MDIKWGKGYQCSLCGCKKSKKGRSCFYLRCTSCGYDESVTANTVFHSIKMPILKALQIALRVAAKTIWMSTVELGNEVGMHQKKAWLFKRKLQAVMEQGGKDKPKGNVDVDEMLVGGYSVPSAKGGNFEELHEQIMMFKNWLRGIHHKCSKKHLHAYLDEYKYRCYKRNMRPWIFNDLLGRLL